MTNDQKNLVIAYQQTFSTDAGKTVLEHMKERCNFYRSHMPISGPITQEMATRCLCDEARRTLVMEIMQKVESKLETPKQELAITEDTDNG